MSLSTLVRPGDSITATISAQPGDVAWTLVSATASQDVPFGVSGGTFLLAPPFTLHFLGRVDGNGMLSINTAPLGPLPPGALPLTAFVQAVLDVPGSGLTVSGGRSLSAID